MSDLTDLDRAMEFAGCVRMDFDDGTVTCSGDGHGKTAYGWPRFEWPCPETVRVLRLIQEVLADTLDSLAAEMEAPDWSHVDDWNVPVIYPNALQARAEKIREGS